ncbi:MAG: winged helix-turn-helix transcriptional regulator [Acidobacteria bacterium]|nr:winged helix-turn-helix transcriptional regulator [Acidobacteriota bacterium]
MKKYTLNDAMVQEICGLFAALGDPSRLKILRAILQSAAPLSQREIAETVGLSQANASKHLGVLVRAGLATRRPEGNLVFFEAVDPLVGQVCDLVCSHVSERARSAYHALK